MSGRLGKGVGVILPLRPWRRRGEDVLVSQAGGAENAEEVEMEIQDRSEPASAVADNPTNLDRVALRILSPARIWFSR